MQPRKRRKVPDIFARRFIITIPPFGVYVIAGGVIVSFFLPDAIRVMTNLICVIAAFACVVAAVLVRHELSELRFKVHSILHDIDNEDLDLDETPLTTVTNLTDIPRSTFKKMNGTNVTRLSGS